MGIYMWPFKSKDEARKRKLGIDGDKFHITADELVYVEKLISSLKGYAFRAELIDKINEVLTSVGLSHYAMHEMDMFDYDGEKEHIYSAITSTVKAYSIYQLPIYAYDIARYSEKIGDIEKTKSYYLKFLKIQSEYIKDQNFEMGMASRNIEEAIEDAINKI